MSVVLDRFFGIDPFSAAAGRTGERGTALPNNRPDR
jgi:hypothetical protein